MIKLQLINAAMTYYTDCMTSRLFRKSFNVVYLSFDIYKIIMTSCQAFYCTNEKGKCEKICFCNYRSGLPSLTRRPVITKKKKAYVRIKRVKSDSYLSYCQSCKTLNYTYSTNMICLCDITTGNSKYSYF
jgi:hypothetical protein